jgi:predicted metal-dependent phosphoesterase TrpH
VEAVVGKLVKKLRNRKQYTKGETIYKTIQKHRIHKIENKQNYIKKNKQVLSMIVLMLDVITS